MKQSWQTLNDIINSINALQADRYHSIESLEIKESANKLETSLQPCFQELSASSQRLNELIENSLKELEQAKSIWKSKEKIANANTTKIWSEITILTGLSIKTKSLSRKYKKSAHDKSNEICSEIFRKLTDKHFRDKSKEIKSKIGWGDKTAFIKNAKFKINYIYVERFNEILSPELKNMFDEMRIIDYKFLSSCFYLFDFIHKKKYIEKYRGILNKLAYEIENTKQIDNTVLLKFSILTNDTLDNWQRFGDIYYIEIWNSKQAIIKSSTSRVNSIIDDRISYFNEIIEQIITFYSELLEKQNRYRDETIENRLAEYSWIEQQRETLLQMQSETKYITEMGYFWTE